MRDEGANASWFLLSLVLFFASPFFAKYGRPVREGLEKCWDDKLNLCLDYDLRADRSLRVRTVAGSWPQRGRRLRLDSSGRVPLQRDVTIIRVGNIVCLSTFIGCRLLAGGVMQLVPQSFVATDASRTSRLHSRVIGPP